MVWFFILFDWFLVWGFLVWFVVGLFNNIWTTSFKITSSYCIETTGFLLCMLSFQGTLWCNYHLRVIEWMRILGICPYLVFPKLPITSNNNAIHYCLLCCIFISQITINTSSTELAFCDFPLLKTSKNQPTYSTFFSFSACTEVHAILQTWLWKKEERYFSSSSYTHTKVAKAYGYKFRIWRASVISNS